MAHVDDDRPSAETPTPSGKEPPYQALFPNLDNVSRSSFRKGTLSRRRINIAVVVLGIVLIVVAGLVLFSGALFGPM